VFCVRGTTFSGACRRLAPTVRWETDLHFLDHAVVQASGQSACVTAPLIMRFSFAQMVQKPRNFAQQGVHLSAMRLFTSVRHKDARSSCVFYYSIYSLHIAYLFLLFLHIRKARKAEVMIIASHITTDDFKAALRPIRPNCNVLGVLYSRWNFIALPKVNTLQLNTVGNSWNIRTRPTRTVSEHQLL
jgi:hypothetical protein